MFITAADDGGSFFYYIGNFRFLCNKASGRMRTAAYNEDVANDFYNS